MGSRLRVLLVDDEDDILRIGHYCLSRIAGWEVSTAPSGEQGIVLAERDRPDVVLLDLMLPGCDGGATLVELKRRPATTAIPVIVMTAAPEGDKARACLARGAAGIIGKPFDPIGLPAQIERILRGVA